MTQTEIQVDFSYERLESGVHKLIYLTATRSAVDAFFAQLQVLFEDYYAREPGDEPLLLLVDMRPAGSLPPVSYTLQTGIAFFRSHPNHPAMYAAYLNPEVASLSLLRSFLAILRINTRRRFFQGLGDDIEQQALDWLLSAN